MAWSSVKMKEKSKGQRFEWGEKRAQACASGVSAG